MLFSAKFKYQVGYLQRAISAKFSVLAGLGVVLLGATYSYATIAPTATPTQTIGGTIPGKTTILAGNIKALAILRYGHITVGNREPYGAIGWALDQGKLKQDLEKLGFSEIKTIPFPNGPNLNEALAAGQIDVANYGDAPAIVGRSRGLPTRLISQSQVGMNVWLLGKRGGPKTLADLKGQKITTSKGSYMHRYLLGLLQETGLASQVTIVHLLPADAPAALERGDVAAYAAPIGLGPLLLQKGYPLLDEAAKHPNLRGSSVTVATEAFLAKYPNFPQQWNGIQAKYLAQIKANPEAYYKFHAKVTGYPVDAVKASFPLIQFNQEPLPQEGLQLLEGTKKFLVSEGLAKQDFKLTDWIVPQVQRSRK